MSVSSAPMKQTMGKGTNIGWIGRRATCAVEATLSSGSATADLPCVGTRSRESNVSKPAGFLAVGCDFGRAFQAGGGCPGTTFDLAWRNRCCGVRLAFPTFQLAVQPDVGAMMSETPGRQIPSR